MTDQIVDDDVGAQPARDTVGSGISQVDRREVVVRKTADLLLYSHLRFAVRRLREELRTLVQEFVTTGRIGSLSPRFYGVPFDYSQRRTTEQDAPTVLRFLQEDAVDAVVVVPHCPVCHQSSALVVRHLEAAGIPTVLVGSARDIIEEIGVPRFLFVDFPLGYPTGRPGDRAQQAAICAQALDLLEGAWAPRTTVQADARWGDDAWRTNYMRVDDTTRAALEAAGANRREDQQRARSDGRARTS